MKLLVLGGTRFIGLHLVAAALARGHEVTLFNRGRHRPAPSANVEAIHGDRNSDLNRLQGRRWDAAVDTSGYLPRAVKASAESLRRSVNRYVFISSRSVYADLSVPGVDETSPVVELTDEQLKEADGIDSSGQVSAETYGAMYAGLKVLCERAAEQALPGRALVIRPGLVVGPYDYTDRFTYWVVRVARGGEVLAPGRPDRYVQFIDARDLAEWTVGMIEREAAGVYNAAGPSGVLTMGAVLDGCRAVSKSDASFTWVSDEFLKREEVAAWSEMPLWIPEQEAPHLKAYMLLSSQKAVDSGLSFRPVQETAGDTLAWREMDCPDEELKAGIAHHREQRLLRKWHETY